jgi:outer membrane protein with beta-barrel domain
MRKILVFIPISFCFLFSANAQLKWGANAGISISNVHHIEAVDPKSLVTLQSSGFAAIPVGNSFVIQPSLGYRGKGYKIDGSFDSTRNHTSIAYNYLQLSAPVLLRCNTNENYKLYAGAGPYLAYLLNVRRDGSHLPIDNYNRLDFGFDFSINLTIGKRWVVALASDLGLSNVYSLGSGVWAESPSNISSGISLGYFIN